MKNLISFVLDHPVLVAVVSFSFSAYFFSQSANAADCLRFKNSTTYTNGAIRYQYDYLGSHVAACNDLLAITKAEYNELLNGTHQDSTSGFVTISDAEYTELTSKTSVLDAFGIDSENSIVTGEQFDVLLYLLVVGFWLFSFYHGLEAGKK